MKILIADDHPLVLAGLREIVTQFDPAAETLAAGSLPEVLELVSAHPDLALALIDFRMPGMTGVASVRRVVYLAPTVPVVVVSAFHADGFAADLEAAGAAGLIPKSVGEPAIADALRRVLAGDRCFPKALAGEPAPDGHDPGPAAAIASLTRREREVLEHLSTGLSNKEIARRLGCSDATIKVHVKAILRKFGVHSRSLVIALMHGRA